MKAKHIIWTSTPDYSDWEDDLREEYPDCSEDERIQIMYNLNAEYLNDERANLNIVLPRPILVIGDLGLWNGRRSGYKELQSGNIRDCLYASGDAATWYVDANGNLRCDDCHHDGTNHYLYRTYKDGASDRQIELLKDKIYNGTATSADISRVTRRLGDAIGAVYGWEFPKRGRKRVSGGVR